MYNIHHIHCLTNYLSNELPELLERLKCQIVYFFPVPTIAETAMRHYHLFNEDGFDLV